MADIYGSGSTSSGGFKQPKRPSASQESQANLGRVAFNISKPGESIRESTQNVFDGFANLGKGAVNVIENLPIVGAIARPAISLVGGALDATIGTGVRFLEDTKVGDRSASDRIGQSLELLGAPFAAALEVAATPGRELEKAVARARVQSASDNKNDLITTIFGTNGLERYRSMNLDSATLDDIGEELANKNAGFSENGAANLLYSLVIDPLNLVSFGAGSGLKAINKAGTLARAGVVEGRVLTLEALNAAKAAGKADEVVKLTNQIAKFDKQIEFLDKWGFAAELQAAATSKLKGLAKLGGDHSAKELAFAWLRVFDVPKFSGMLDMIDPTFVKRGLKNYAVTAKYTTGAASVRRATEQVRAQAFATSESYVSQLVNGIRSGKTFDEIFSGADLGGRTGRKAYTTLRNVIYSARKGTQKLAKAEKELVKRLERSGASSEVIEARRLALREKMAAEVKQLDEPFYRLQNVLKKKIEEKAAISQLTVEQIIRLPDIQPIIDDIERIITNGRVRRERVTILANAEARAAADVRIASDEATRVLREAKLEVYDLVATKSDNAIETVSKWVAAGLGMSPEAAIDYTRRVFATYGDDLEALADFAAFARGAAYGEASRKLARLVTTFDEGEEWTRLTLVSARTLTQDLAEEYVARIKALKEELQSVADMPRDQRAMFNRSADDIEAELTQISDELRSKFDEVAMIHGNGRPAAWQQVTDYVEKGFEQGAFAVRLNADEYGRIYRLAEKDERLQALVRVGDDINDAGYYLGKAPKEGVKKILTVVDDATRGERIVETLVPFFDNIAETSIDELDQVLGKMDLRPSRTQQVRESIHRQYGAEITRSKATEAFIASMVSKAGLTVGEARDLMVQINRLAADVGTQPRGLHMEMSQVSDLFQKVLGEGRYSKYLAEGNDPIKDIIAASGGDWRVFGYSTALSTRVKARMPAITQMTDRIFGQIRFGELNPWFQRVLERVETATMKFIYNIWDDASDDVLGELGVSSRRRAFLDRNNINRERADNFFDHHTRLIKATAAAAESSPSFFQRAKKFILKPGREILDEKKVARDLMADRFAAQEFIAALSQTYPELMPKMARHFGTTTPEDTLRLLLEESVIKTNPELLAQRIADEAPQMVGLSVKALTDGGMELADAQRLVGLFTGVWSTQLLKGMRKADTLQYFATQRSWLERSLNHPFLGVYPYSYMTRKAIPAMMRLLFLTPGPGGRVLPLVGLNSWADIVEWADNRSNTDSSFLDALALDDAFLYILQSVSPVTPDSMGFATIPTYLKRTLAQPAYRGQDIGVGDLARGLLTGAGEQVLRGTAFGQIPLTFEAIQSLEQRTGINQYMEQQGEEIQKEIFNAFTNP